MQNPLLIVGASSRAAAASAVRADRTPNAIDMFADVDLQQIATTRRSTDFPNDLVRLAAQFDPQPFLYTGGLENHPDVIADIARRHTLLGTLPQSLRTVRDPTQWTACLRNADIAVPEIHTGHDPPDLSSNWLQKPIDGVGGRGIEICDASFRNRRSPDAVFYQQRIVGTPLSATFSADGLTTRLLGVTRQLVGLPSVAAPPFAWCGSVGPLNIPASLQQQLLRLGTTLATQFSLRGVLGIDLVHDGRTAWPIEINPRYPGSAEVIELAGNQSVIGEHLRACGQSMNGEWTSDGVRMCAAKIIVYAAEAITVDDPEQLIDRNTASECNVADIPQPGTHIEPGQPICTILAQNSTMAECMGMAVSRVESLTRRLYNGTGHQGDFRDLLRLESALLDA